MTTESPIIWTGDLNDDCTATWNGLILRAEWMEKKYWWWAVSINDGRLDEIDSSNNYDTFCIGGENARKSAEDVARKYMSVLSKLPDEIDGALVDYYLILDSNHVKTGSTRHLNNGNLVEEIQCLAICNYTNDGGYNLFYCDHNWQTLADTYHDTIEGAMAQAEFEFSNTINWWINKS